MKRILIAATFASFALLPAATPTLAQPKETVRTEAQEHPRIGSAIREMEEAIRYMEAAPHDFGGHKAAAIRATRAAVQELRAALAFRARQDNRK